MRREWHHIHWYDVGDLLRCIRAHVVVVCFAAYSPLGGLKTRRGDISIDRFPKIVAMAKSRGVDPYTMLLRVMCVRFPAMIILVGSRDVRKVSALSGVHHIKLSEREAKELWA